MKPKTALVVVLLAVAGVIAWFVLKKPKGDDPADPKPAVATTDGGTAAPPPRPSDMVTVTLEYSTEKRDWLEAAVHQFETENPEVKVNLIGKGSIESANAILDQTDKPTMWSPADSSIANLLASDWETKQHKPLWASGETAPQPLLLTPLVFAVWEERAKVLIDAAHGEVSWKAIHQAVTSPKGWPAIGGKQAWGFVKLGHTDPNRSNSGMQALVSMAFEYFNTKSLTVDQMLDPKFQEFVKQIEASVGKFESSTGTFMNTMIQFGPSRIDIAVVYESLAVAELEHAQGRWGSLHIYYPHVTIWSDHPIAILDAPWVTAAQKAAAGKLVAYLRSPKVQTTALRFGFRPANTSVAIKNSDASNPFTKMQQYGLTIELPDAAQPVDGAVARNLLMMWSRVVKK
jgi:ABC-type Fe3+ transport system substrate-binding protein